MPADADDAVHMLGAGIHAAGSCSLALSAKYAAETCDERCNVLHKSDFNKKGRRSLLSSDVKPCMQQVCGSETSFW